MHTLTDTPGERHAGAGMKPYPILIRVDHRDTYFCTFVPCVSDAAGPVCGNGPVGGGASAATQPGQLCPGSLLIGPHRTRGNLPSAGRPERRYAPITTPETSSNPLGSCRQKLPGNHLAQGCGLESDLDLDLLRASLWQWINWAAALITSA